MAKAKERQIIDCDIKISDLKYGLGNPRKITQSRKNKLKNSVKRFGVWRSIGIDNENNVVFGNQLIDSVKAQYGKDHILKAKRLIGYTEKELKAICIKDNEHEGEWDYEKLNDWMEQLKDFDKEFDVKDEMDKKKVEDDIPEIKKPTVSPGDLWRIGNHYLLCGDSTKEICFKILLNNNKINMIFIDPPYAVNYNKDWAGNVSKTRKYSKINNDDLSAKACAEKLWKPAFNNLFVFAGDSCSLYMTMCQGGDQMMMMMMMMMAVNWQIKHELIWVKNSPVFSMGRLDYDYRHEPILFGWKKNHKFYGKGKFQNSIWEIPKPNRSDLHPTMKPVELMENAILNSSKEKDIVCDCFVGSGSTLIACEKTGRAAYVMENDPYYCQVTIDRYKKYTGRSDVELVGNYNSEIIKTAKIKKE